jgi:hypothetical protein
LFQVRVDSAQLAETARAVKLADDEVEADSPETAVTSLDPAGMAATVNFTYARRSPDGPFTVREPTEPWVPFGLPDWWRCPRWR